MPSTHEINRVLEKHPIFVENVNGVQYFEGEGFNVLLTTAIGKCGRHLAAPRLGLQEQPVSTLYVSICTSLIGTPLGLGSTKLIGLVPGTDEIVVFNELLMPVETYGETIHGVWTLAARQGLVLRLA